MNRSSRCLALAGLLVLAACGGGGGGGAEVTVPPTANDAVPDAASASTLAMKKWLLEVAATAPDDREALDVARFAPPQPDDSDAEPLP